MSVVNRDFHVIAEGSAGGLNPPRGPDERDLCFAPTSDGECARCRGSIFKWVLFFFRPEPLHY